jgi:DNA-binding transcriptional ArsR family regulator
MKAEKSQGIAGRVKRTDAKREVDKRIVTGMANSLRTQVLVSLNERTATATELARELRAPFEKVSYEMNALKKVGLIEKVAQKQIRGAVAQYYRATEGACIDQAEWPSVPDALKEGLRGSLLETMTDDAVAAISEETFDSLDDAHMSWMPMLVDEQGWNGVTEILRRALNEVIEVRESSRERMTAKDAVGIPCTVSMLGYGSAAKARKVGPPPDATQPIESTELRALKNSGKRSRSNGREKFDATGEG